MTREGASSAPREPDGRRLPDPRLAHLEGYLRVLHGVADELRAIGAPEARRERIRGEIDRLRAELARIADT